LPNAKIDTVRSGSREGADVTGRPKHYVAGLPRPDRALAMAALNVTPDSFSDGGKWLEPDRAIAHGLQLWNEGADIVDVGGESTRPGAGERPSEDEECRRVLPVIAALAAAGVPVSVDTMRAGVARRAVEAGARLVNDISGGLAESTMLPTVAETGVAYACMHWRGHYSATTDERASYDDVVAELLAELRVRVDAVLAAGIAPDRLAIDPGLGFAKTRAQDWEVLGQLDRLHALGLPVLLGGSRKRFLGELLADPETGVHRPPEGRDDAGTALAALAAHAGVWCVRSHVARPTVDALRMAARWSAPS
jgi:dihydropteroate synthase